MDRRTGLEKLGLKYNPFPPAATGATFGDPKWIPESWEDKIAQSIQGLSLTEGAKAIAIVGPYGTGKTFLLQWIIENQYIPRRIQAYFIKNPGVTFYALADQLLRQVGRNELSKGLWELLQEDIPSHTLQQDLFKREFSVWLGQLNERNKRDKAIRDIQSAIIKQNITGDEEIAFSFGRMIVDTKDRPYYRFQDFVPRSSGSLVAEQQEGEYFKTLIRILKRIHDAEGIAFLIDEFEDAALGKRLSRRQSAEYHSTLRNLLDTARDEDFWLTLSSTPQGFEQTRSIEPPLMQRFGSEFRIPPLTDQDAHNLVYQRLKNAKIEGSTNGLWPFADDVVSAIMENNRAWPRGLVKVLSQSLTSAIREGVDPPIPNSLVQTIEAGLPAYQVNQDE